MRHVRVFAVVSMLMVLCGPIAVAQESERLPEPDQQVADQQSPDTVFEEEITVTGTLLRNEAGIVGAAQEAMLLSAKALTFAERPLARGEYAGAVNQPRPRTRWIGRRGVRCPVVLASPAGAWVACVPDGRENEVAIWLSERPRQYPTW